MVRSRQTIVIFAHINQIPLSVYEIVPYLYVHMFWCEWSIKSLSDDTFDIFCSNDIVVLLIMHKLFINKI
jgi:hypothetical protein